MWDSHRSVCTPFLCMFMGKTLSGSGNDSDLLRNSGAQVRRLKLSVGHERVSCVLVDFMSAASVREGAAAIVATTQRLDMLVLNAGT